MLTLNELLALRRLDIHNTKVKLLRHKDTSYDLAHLLMTDEFDTYQACQSSPRLECDYVVSFIAGPKTSARFVGVYRVLGKKSSVLCEEKEIRFLKDKKTGWFYELQKLPGFEDLENRVIIDWGRSTISWHQWLHGDTDSESARPKEVIQILPQGYTRPFPGYLDFILSYPELCQIITFPDANQEWTQALSHVGGIYLITVEGTGAQYVGSAYGVDGLLGRWRNYASNGHGGNKALVELSIKDNKFKQQLRFSILRTVDKSLSKTEVIALENFYKVKLGSRVHGLNEN